MKETIVKILKNIYLARLKGTLSPIFSITLKSQKTYLFQWEPLLTITLLVHSN